jgi:uncharacterized membrane protein
MRLPPINIVAWVAIGLLVVIAVISMIASMSRKNRQS